MNLSVAGNYQFQLAPGGQAVVNSIGCQATYTALQLGVVDVPSGSPSGTVFQLPFGGVATGKGYAVKANAGIMLGINAGTGISQMQGLATGTQLTCFGTAAAQPAQAITGMVVVLPRQAGTDGTIEYMVYGD